MATRPPIQAVIEEQAELDTGRRNWRMVLFNEDGTPFTGGGGSGGGGGAVYARLFDDWSGTWDPAGDNGRLLIPPDSGLYLEQMTDPDQVNYPGNAAYLMIDNIRPQMFEVIHDELNESLQPDVEAWPAGRGNIRFGPGLVASLQPNPGVPTKADMVIEAAAPEAAHLVGAAGEPAFGTNWANHSNSANLPAGFYKHDGHVFLQGTVAKSVAIANGDVIFTLPVGYRPSGIGRYVCQSNGQTAFVDVLANGQVFVETGANHIGLDGISFRAA